jgi:hypothetical protein
VSPPLKLSEGDAVLGELIRRPSPDQRTSSRWRFSPRLQGMIGRPVFWYWVCQTGLVASATMKLPPLERFRPSSGRPSALV